MGKCFSCISSCCNDTETQSNGSDNSPVRVCYVNSVNVEELVLKTLGVIRLVLDQEPPAPMLELHLIAEKEQGWLQVVEALVNVVPLSEPLGPVVINLVLDECPLPSKDTIMKMCQILPLSQHTSAMKTRDNVSIHRNIAVVLGCISEKMAGPSSMVLVSNETLEYIFSNLMPTVGYSSYAVILHSLIALEKLAKTSENKLTIEERFNKYVIHPLQILENIEVGDFDELQVRFCAEWCLDNLFSSYNRLFTYTVTDNSNVQCMLNTDDVSEYLKISADGLQARSDASSFESVRSTFEVTVGVFYYEVRIITGGVMQIGWATKRSKFLNHEGYGIGDDYYSIAYDGCRQLIWFAAESEPHEHAPWNPGDILGCLLDTREKFVKFSLNGKCLPPIKDKLFEYVAYGEGVFAAASFMSFQQCEFNFGAQQFAYPPDCEYSDFNTFGYIAPEDRVVIPRLMKMMRLRQMTFPEDSCSLCYDKKASMTLRPCGHSGFCPRCCDQLDTCPICRAIIDSRQPSSESSADAEIEN